MDHETALQLFTAYLNRRYGDRSTPMHYLSDVRLFYACIGVKAPRDVTAHDIARFVDAQREQGRSARTINRRLAALHTFFEVLAGELPDQPWPNPVHWRRHKAQLGLRLPRDVADATVTQLFASIRDPRDTALFGLMVGAGLRVGEVAALQLADLSAPAQPTQLARLRVCGKGRKERVVWLTPTYYAQVAAWLAVRPASSTPDLFLSQRGHALGVDGIQARLASYCAAAGVTLTCHQLRHTFARRLAEQQMPIAGIAKLLGHAQVATTQVYTAGADPDLRTAFEQAMQPAAPPVVPTVTAPPAAPAAPPAPRRVTPADPAHLTAALARLVGLPAWLHDVLVIYVRRSWFTWKPHLAAEHADRLTRQLVRLWTWLLTWRPLTGWADLQRSDLAAWLAARQAAGIAVTTQRHELAKLLAVLHCAADQDLPVAANLFRIAYPVAAAPLPRALSEAEYARLAATVLTPPATAPTTTQEQAWFLTLAQTGVRVNELLDLRLSDLDLVGRRLLIRQAKNGADRWCYLTPPLLAALQSHLAQRPPSADDHLWLLAGQPLTANHIRYRLRTWGQACEVLVSPHRLRHTFATRLVNQGLDLAAVGKLLGHTTLQMTQHYGRLYDTTVQRQFEAAMCQSTELALAQPTTAATPRLVTAEADSL